MYGIRDVPCTRLLDDSRGLSRRLLRFPGELYVWWELYIIPVIPGTTGIKLVCLWSMHVPYTTPHFVLVQNHGSTCLPCTRPGRQLVTILADSITHLPGTAVRQRSLGDVVYRALQNRHQNLYRMRKEHMATTTTTTA